jgi:hypothetical protein
MRARPRLHARAPTAPARLAEAVCRAAGECHASRRRGALPTRRAAAPRAQVGSLTSLFPIAYGFSKFVSGVLGARTSPTLMLSGGLLATAAVNLLFGAGNAMPWFMTFWALNGILQARPPAGRHPAGARAGGAAPAPPRGPRPAARPLPRSGPLMAGAPRRALAARAARAF